MTYAVGDKVRTLRPLADHPAGTETTIEAPYTNPYGPFDYRLAITGSLGTSLAVYADEIEPA